MCTYLFELAEWQHQEAVDNKANPANPILASGLHIAQELSTFMSLDS